MSSNYDNEPVPASSKRVRHKLDLRMLYAGAAVIAAVVILILCMTVFFNVSDIEVRGVSLYTSEQIINIGGIHERMNLVRTDAARAEKRLTDNLVYIDEVKISKAYPSTVVIDCKEAVKAADIQYDDGYYVLSTSGKILEAANPKPTGGIPVVTGFRFYTAEDETNDDGEPLSDEEKFAYRASGAKLRSEDEYSDKIIIDLLSELNKQKFEDVRSIDITSRANIIINIDDRLDLKPGSSADIEYKLSYFKAVIGKLAPKYEGTLIYNGTANGVSAIPKDKYLGKATFAKDPEKTEDDSSSADTDSSKPDSTGINNNTGLNDGNTDNNQDNNGWTDNAWDDGGWTDNTWDDGGWTDNTWDDGGWTDNTWDDGGWTDNTWDDGNYYDNTWDNGGDYSW